MTGPGRQLSRRTFLRLGLGLGAAGVCSCFFPARLLAATAQVDAATAKRLMAEFQDLCQGVAAWLGPRVGAGKASAIAQACQARFAALIPGLPDLGPANRNAESFMEAVWLTAITQAMRAHGLPESQAGRLLYDLCAEEMAQRPADQLRAQGQAMFTPRGRAELKAWAEESQKRRFPADWVGVAVLGEGGSFDVGYDYSECGAVKYFQANGVAAVAPYFCLNDFLLSRAQGTGLARVHTIGQGDALCDFRYKKDRPVVQSWETEVPRFAKKAG